MRILELIIDYIPDRLLEVLDKEEDYTDEELED